MHLQDTERALEQEDEQDERHLAHLHPHVEQQQRERDLGLGQPHGGEAAREAEAVEQAEGEGHHPRWRIVKLVSPSPGAHDLSARETGC